MIQMSGPVVIGGVGGSGTRVIAQILSTLGFYMGRDLNPASDNLWFTLLFKRPKWYQDAHDQKRRFFKGLRILSKAMTCSAPFSPTEIFFVLHAAIVMSFTGHNPAGEGKGKWAFVRARKLLSPKKEFPPGYCGWGWKEPNSHIYLEHMAEYFEHFRYIHTVRHGIDMAFSGNQQQLFNWGPIYGIENPTNTKEVPSASLRYWVKANQHVLKSGERLGHDGFLMVNFDKLCTSPKSEIEAIIRFLNVHPNETTFDKLCKMPKKPKSMGRYLNYDLSQFDAGSISAVRHFGFNVDVTD